MRIGVVESEYLGGPVGHEIRTLLHSILVGSDAID
jgi:hypothetical protein